MLLKVNQYSCDYKAIQKIMRVSVNAHSNHTFYSRNASLIYVLFFIMFFKAECNSAVDADMQNVKDTVHNSIINKN